MLLGIIVDAFLETNNSLGVKETVIDEMKQSWARWMGRRDGLGVWQSFLRRLLLLV